MGKSQVTKPADSAKLPMEKPKWFKANYKSPNRPKGQAPVTFIESNLMDLKGRTMTDRVWKDTWGTGDAWMNDLVEKIGVKPDMSQEDVSADQKNGFYPAGTTTIAKGQPSINANKLKKSGLGGTFGGR